MQETFEQLQSSVRVYGNNILLKIITNAGGESVRKRSLKLGLVAAVGDGIDPKGIMWRMPERQSKVVFMDDETVFGNHFYVGNNNDEYVVVEADDVLSSSVNHPAL